MKREPLLLESHPPREIVTATDAKAMILTAANVLAGVMGFFESLEKGVLAGDAARLEVEKAGRRARALAHAENGRVKPNPKGVKSRGKSSRKREPA